MKVIFLDFDGVITTPSSKWNISIELVKRVKKICDATGAKLVISSTWQHGNSAKEWLEEGVLMKSYKGWLKKFFVDYTYDVTGRHAWNGSTARGAEIKAWLVKHSEVDNYVIIDDEYVCLESQVCYFVLTNPHDGITEDIADRVIAILNRESAYFQE